jgi:hypothetical protein
MGELYWISIVDTAPPSTARAIKYRTSIRITFETEGHRHNPTECWQLWKERRGANDAHQRGGKLHAVECTIEAMESTYCGLESTHVRFKTASVDGFFVEWLARGSGGLECNIPVKFHFLSTDFSHSKSVGRVPVRLCVKTEMVWCEPLSISTMPEDATELCHCIVELLTDYAAEGRLWSNLQMVKVIINELKQRISSEEVHPKRSANAYQTGSVPRSTGAIDMSIGKWYTSSWLNACRDENAILGKEELQLKLSTLEDQLLRENSVTYLDLPGNMDDDPDLHPISNESKLDNNHNRRHSETSFWTGQHYRPPSKRSRSSSMNSSLHGTPTFDPEEQNPVFVPSSRPRLQKSSEYHNEPSNPHSPSVKIGPYDCGGSSACIPAHLSHLLVI